MPSKDPARHSEKPRRGRVERHADGDREGMVESDSWPAEFALINPIRRGR
jgi:hypothetical protein